MAGAEAGAGPEPRLTANVEKEVAGAEIGAGKGAEMGAGAGAGEIGRAHV